MAGREQGFRAAIARNISTTSIYAHMTQDDLAEALELLAQKRAAEWSS